MRRAIHDTATDSDPDRLLTTGEAAKILDSSRQHIVDLCNRGSLPHTTVGQHRRVRLGDLESLMSRTERLSRDQRRSLWLAHATAGRIVEDPFRARAVGRANLDKMRGAARGQAVQWLDDWDRLLDGPIEKVLEMLTARDLRGREMRQNAPFAGLLDANQRDRVLDAWRIEDRRGRS